MNIAVLTLNFGEPAEADPEAVTRYLERIFLANAELEPGASESERRERSRELAERRLPGLLEEYRSIGESPLNEQARWQAEALEEELRERGFRASTHLGMQFTEPFIEDALRDARRGEADLVVGLPIYPLCGRSTTVAALNELDRALERVDWDVGTSHVSGWHRHPAYLELRAHAVRRTFEENDLELGDPDVRLVFSAHGTPRKYLDDGNRYDRYVDEYCREVAGRLGAAEWSLGFQNHGNRRIEWTEPEVEDVVADADVGTVVVDPMSFVHEQSETLSELDVELREVAEERGRAFHRVPVPHDDRRLVEVLADLVDLARLRHDGAGSGPSAVQGPHPATRPCRCRPAPGTFCLNVDDD